MPPVDRNRSNAKRSVAYPLHLPNGQGLIARNGHILQPPRYAVVRSLPFCDHLGRPMEAVRYFALGEYRNGRLRFALFDENGRKHSDFLYEDIVSVGDVMLCRTPQKTQIYEAQNGHILLDIPYRTVTVSEGMIVATHPSNSRDKPLAVYTRTGRRVKVDKPWSTNHTIEYHSGLALVFEGNIASYLDKNGRVAIQSPFVYYGAGNYGDVYPFNHAGCAAGRTKPKLGGKFCIIDRKGSFILPPESTRIRQFIDGRFAVLNDKERRFALRNPKGTKLTEARYADVQQEDFGFLSAKEGEHWHLLDNTGAPIAIPPVIGYEITNVEPSGTNALTIQYASRNAEMTGLLSTKGEWLVEPGDYAYVRPYCVHKHQAYYRVLLPGEQKTLLINGKGETVTQLYDDLSYLGDDLSLAVLNGQSFLIDLADKILWKSRAPENPVRQETPVAKTEAAPEQEAALPL